MSAPKFAMSPRVTSLDQWPDSIMLLPGVRTEILALPVWPTFSSGRPTAWIAGRRQAEVRVDGMEVDVALCVEPEPFTVIRASRPIPRNLDPTAVLAVVLDSLLSPQPGRERYRPQIIACDEEAMAEKLQPVLERLGIQAGVTDPEGPLEIGFKNLRFYPITQSLGSG